MGEQFNIVATDGEDLFKVQRKSKYDGLVADFRNRPDGTYKIPAGDVDKAKELEKTVKHSARQNERGVSTKVIGDVVHFRLKPKRQYTPKASETTDEKGKAGKK